MNFWWPFGANKKTKAEAQARLDHIMARSRDPVLYADAGVPDTIDGRFQLLGLFAVLDMMTIEDKTLRQALYDKMFMTCEMSLREIGIGDLSIPKKLKAMFIAFNGHAVAYEACVRGKSDWREVLLRNVYGTTETRPTDAQLDVLIDFINRHTGEGQYPPEVAS